MAHFAGGPATEAVEKMKRDFDRWLARASRLEAELARTPASRARLGLHLALGKRALTIAELHEQAALEEAGEQ